MTDAYHKLKNSIGNDNVVIVAVSKFQPIEKIKYLYDLGHRDFGENYVQELLEKAQQLKDYTDIRWHFIGHLQTNKTKLLLPIVDTIQSVDSVKLLQQIQKNAFDHKRKIKILLQLKLSTEETKFGLTLDMCKNILAEYVKETSLYSNIIINGLMMMTTNTEDTIAIEKEFATTDMFFQDIKKSFPQLADFNILSMGMSHDYTLALKHHTTMLRIGSLIFGNR